ncbi:HNH endonuclease signature motif containing protein [Amnibacterium sp.]|uniref:HNH endonuclease n=1 Tax=Amnibacterium sp. TaxID=1872496 RepID=UPI00261D8547|nr:HNH endonuclease signature motif containing protein [Amnibacterium sp.]
MFEGWRDVGEILVGPGLAIGWSGGPEPPLAVECGWFEPVDAVQVAFDLLKRREAQQRIAEARRIEALLDAYELATADLVERFGRSAGGRSGSGTLSFLKQVAAELQMTEGTLGHLLDAACDLRESMPLTWQRFIEGRAPWRAVDIALAQSQGVPMDRMCEYDDLAAAAVEHTHAARLKDRLRRARERLFAESAATRRHLAEQNRRVRLESMADGQATIEIVGGATDWVPVDHALTAAAVAAKGLKDETRSIGQLRHDILLDIITEGLKTGALPDPATKVTQRKGVAVELLLTVPVLSLLGKGTALASLEGYGPVDLEKARELAAEAPSFVRVLTDPVTGVRLTMDRTTYRPPADLKRWIRIRDQECRDPGCGRPARHSDIDHVQEWQHDGATDAVNLVSICRSMHLLKSMGLWRQTVHPDESVTWTSPWGRTITDPPLERAAPAPPCLLGSDDPDDCPF